MSRAATAGFGAIYVAGLALVIGYFVYLATGANKLYVEHDTSAIQYAIGTEVKAANARLTPTATVYKSPTPTPTDSPPTETPRATYGAQTTPGLYMYEPPQIPPTPYEVDWPLCEDLAASPTPTTFKRLCEVKGE